MPSEHDRFARVQRRRRSSIESVDGAAQILTVAALEATVSLPDEHVRIDCLRESPPPPAPEFLAPKIAECGSRRTSPGLIRAPSLRQHHAHVQACACLGQRRPETTLTRPAQCWPG